MGKPVKHRAKLRRRSSGDLLKKRLFKGNQHANLKRPRDTDEQEIHRTETRVSISISASKFVKSLRENTNKFGESKVNTKNDNITDMGSCFMLLDSDILKSVINLIRSCPKCQKKPVEIISNPAQKKGLFLHLNLMCMEGNCDWHRFFYTSKDVKSDNPGASPFEINYRAIFAIKEIGKGFTELSNFCGFINLPPPINVKAFNDMQEKIASGYTYVADGSMKNAAN